MPGQGLAPVQIGYEGLKSARMPRISRSHVLSYKHVGKLRTARSLMLYEYRTLMGSAIVLALKVID